MLADKAYFVYTFFVLLFYIQQMYQWAQLLQWRKHVLYATPTLLWSFLFMAKLFNIPYNSNITFVTLLFLSLQHLIGWLLFPKTIALDYNSAYTYIDAYEELRQNRFWVFGLAFIGELLYYYSRWVQGGERSLVFVLLFFCAAITEHKGLMLVWVWLGLGYLLVY